MNTFDNITAPASAVGGAVTVIRISGPDALAIGNKVWQGKVPLSSANRRKMLLGTAGNDQTLAVYMQGPNSYTGDDVVALTAIAAAPTRSITDDITILFFSFEPEIFLEKPFNPQSLINVVFNKTHKLLIINQPHKYFF